MNVEDDNSATTKKEKKKNKKKEMEIEQGLKNNGIEERGKKKKKKNKEKANAEDFCETNVSSDENHKKIKKKQKRKREDDVEVVNGLNKSETGQESDGDEAVTEPFTESKKKKKHKKENANNSKDQHLEEEEEEECQVRKKKKKKKKNKTKDVEEGSDNCSREKETSRLEDSEEDKLKNDNKEDADLSNSGNDLVTKRKRKKAGKSEEIIPDYPSEADEQELKEAEVNDKRVKKKRKKKDMDKEPEVEKCDIQVKKKKKDKLNYSENTIEMVNNSGSVKTQESWNSPVFESKERQEKFQRLLGGKQSTPKTPKCPEDPESKNNSKEKDSSSALTSGQWQGMMFENSERQNKFIRLLGGAKSNPDKKKGLFSSGPKKGLYGSLTSKLTTSSSHNGSFLGGNNAMSLQSAASLNQNLEDDYNRALNKRLGGLGSAGIGFVKDPAEGKKFHIDSNATKSTKFSDDE